MTCEQILPSALEHSFSQPKHGSCGQRYADLFENGGAKNAAGLFCNITDVDVLKLRSDIAGYLGAWVGAYGSGYVTYQPGHMSDPQASIIDITME